MPFLSCGSFVAAMAITTGVLMVGAMAWVFVVGRVEQVNWAAKGEVLYESRRTVSAKNGEFHDTFAAFDVHVYRFERE